MIMNRFITIIVAVGLFTIFLSVSPIPAISDSAHKLSLQRTETTGDTTSTFSENIKQSPATQFRIAPETSPYEPKSIPGSLKSVQALQDTLQSWDLSDASQTGQLTIVSTENDGGKRGFQVASGDINGDGHADLVISGPYVSALGRTDCGGAYVFYGPHDLSSSLEFDSADVKIYGPSTHSEIMGLAVGDVNGDGLDDIVLGATGVDEIYLVLGTSSLPTTIDLSTTFDSQMSGIAGERAGLSISLGDINADGRKDILIAAPLGDGPDGTRINCGSYYLVPGRTIWSSSIDLTNETVIYGAEAGDGCIYDWWSGSLSYPGMQIVSGDLNGDGFDDILIGAPGADGPNNARRSECGEAYAVFGHTTLADTIDLSVEADLICYGIDSYDHIVRLGSGDVNGDGIDDFIIGARDADGRYNVLPDAGEVYIVYGRSDLPDTMEMGTQADVTIYGADEGDILGRMIAQDVNGDGVSDLLLGAADADGPNNSRRGCGEAYLLYGYELPPVIELKSYPHHIIYGADAGDGLTGYGSLVFADIDGDQVADLIIGAYDANGLDNDYSDAGEAYVVSGWHLTGYTVDVAVAKIHSPSGEVEKGTTIIPAAEVRNLGLETETFSVNFQIGIDYSETVTVTLAQNEIDTVVFPAWTAGQLGAYAINCSTALAGDENPTNNEKTGTVIVASGPEPVVNRVSPNHGGNSGSLTVEITGARFESGATVKLTKTGQPDIVADTSMTTVVDSSKIITTFDLRDRELGEWSVVVTNPDGSSGAFYSGFTIEEGVVKLWVDIVGRDQIRVGRETQYLVIFGNSGNIDIVQSVILVNVSPNATVFSDAPFAWPADTLGSGTMSKVGFTLSTIQPGIFGTVTFSIIASIAGEIDIDVMVWLDPVAESSFFVQPQLSLKDEIASPQPCLSSHRLHTTTNVFSWPPDPPNEGTIVFQADHGDKGTPITGHEGIMWKDSNTGEMYVWENLPTGCGSTRMTPWEDFCKRTYRDYPNLCCGWQDYYRPKLSDSEKQALHNWMRNHSHNFGESPFPFKWNYKCTEAVHDAFREATGRDLIPFRPHKIWDAPSLDYLLLTGKPWLGPGDSPIYSQIPGLFLDALTGELPKTATLIIASLIFGVQSWDPNDKAGPAGFGEQGFIPQDEQLQYVIYFENVDTATASAEEIVITDTLDTDLDWSTLEFGQTSDTPPTSQSFDTSSGVITWRFEDINLPPNVNPPEGEGWVSFTIKPKEDLPSGTEIRNKATIIFDVNPPMSTGEVLNTIDALPAGSSVLQLAQEQPLSNFEVQWSGADDGSGSGIRDYTIYVSDNGGPYTSWITTDATSAVFTGENEHTYRFYSIARDNVGNIESTPSEPDAIATVKLPSGIEVSPNPFVPTRGHTQTSFFGAGLSYSKIKVYNKAGELVRSLEETEGKTQLNWDATSDDGKRLASGVYIWVSTNQAGKHEKGKFAIIR